MAVPRSGLILWIAWVVTAAIATAVVATTEPSVSGLFPNDLPGAAIEMAFRAVPLALLQYLVLRTLAGLPPLAAGFWVGCSLLAATLYAPATVTWYEQGLSRLPVQVTTNDGLMNVLMAGDRWVYALLFGFAQGLVLANAFRRQIVIVIWVAANLLAAGVAPYVAQLVALPGWIGSPASLPAHVLLLVEYWVVYAAITGLALIAVVRLWGPTRAPAPAARSLPAPTL